VLNPDGSSQVLSVPNRHVFVRGLNDRGQAYGQVDTFDTQGAFFYDGQRISEVMPPNANAQAKDLNEAGQLLVYASENTGRSHALVYKDGKATEIPGDVVVEKINDRGDVLGWSFAEGTIRTVSFIYHDGQFERGIGLFDDITSSTVLNNLGHALGFSDVLDGEFLAPHAFFYGDGRTTDLTQR